MRELLSILLTLLWGFSPVAQAQPRFESVEFGFHGRYLPDTLTPLSVSIGNGSTAVNAILEVTQELRAGSDVVERVRIAIALPPRTRKTLSLDFHVRGVSAPVKLRLLHENGRELTRTEIELRERWSERPFTLALETQEIPDAEIYEFAKLPKRWTSYESLRRLYWGRLDPARLSEEQRTALYQWILRGGELVILGGRYALEHTGRVLPLHRASPETPQGWWMALSPLSHYQIIEDAGIVQLGGEPRPGARVIARDSQGRPLWWERSLGLGQVRLSAIETPDQWERLTERARTRSDEALFVERALGRETIPVPARFWLILMMAFFALGVAVLGAWRLRLTVVWTLSITLLLWAYLRQPDFSRQYYSLEMNLLWGWSGESFALEQSWYAIFARRAGEQQLTVRSDSVQNLARSGQVPQALSVTAGSPQREKQLRFYSEPISVRSFKVERFSPTEIEFFVDSSLHPPRVLIYNRSSVKLEQAAVRWRGSFYILGEITAKSEKESVLQATVTEAEWTRNLDEPARALWQEVRASLAPVALVAWRTMNPSLRGDRETELRRARNFVAIAGAERDL
jgi:hypothetical protein